MNALEFLAVAAAFLAAGFGLGVLADWTVLQELRETVRRQAGALHTDDRTPRHPFTAAGPDDYEARSRVGRRSS